MSSIRTNRRPTRKSGRARAAAVTSSGAGASSKRVLIEVRHRRLDGRGFGAYFSGSAKRGRALIVVDCDAVAWACAAERSLRFKRLFIETIGHEFMHAVEDLFGVMFNERAIEGAIARARKVRA